jgi:hypothetical protein
MQKIEKVFGKKENILIGMIHLPPLLSIKGFTKMENILKKALKDLNSLQRAGFDGALIENDDDKPHTELANPAQIACFTSVAREVVRAASIPIGVQVMLNDWRASISIAKIAGAHFTRLDVFIDHVTCEWGEIKPDPKEIYAYKKSIFPELLLLTDIQVKCKTMVNPRPLAESARLAFKNGSDGVVITGAATGRETPFQKLQEVRDVFPDKPIFVGAGLTAKNANRQLLVANGAIVGTFIKTSASIDIVKAKQLKKVVSDFR